MAIYVFIGEDSVSLDKAYLQFRQNYQTTQFLEPLNQQNLENRVANLSFFPEKKLFVAKNVFSKQLKMGRVAENLKKVLSKLPQFLGDNDFLFLEDDSQKIKHYQKYFLKAKYQRYKISAYLFAFLDSFFPGNLSRCYLNWQKTLLKNPAELAIFMFRRRLRELLAISASVLPGHYQSWQLSKLKSQLNKWETNQLINIYKSLYNYEKSLKTGLSPLKANRIVETILALYL